MYNPLIYFLSIATFEQHKAFRRIANQLTGDVTIDEDVEPIIEALKKYRGIKTAQRVYARRLAYASKRRHYKDGTTIMEDILAGKTNRPASEYI